MKIVLYSDKKLFCVVRLISLLFLFSKGIGSKLLSLVMALDIL